MKIHYVVALAMSAAIGLGGLARSEDRHRDPTHDGRTEGGSSEDGRNLRHLSRGQRPQCLTDLPEPGRADRSLHRGAAACLQGPIARRSRCTGLHVGHGIAAQRCHDQRSGWLFRRPARGAGQARESGPHRTGKAAVRGRRAGSPDSPVRDLSRCSRPRDGHISRASPASMRHTCSSSCW